MDRQQVMTLTGQMYPENPQHLLRHFKEATSKIYGYLLTFIDLKPTTPVHRHFNAYKTKQHRTYTSLCRRPT